MAPRFEALQTEYSDLWARMVVNPSKVDIIDKTARRLLGNKQRYVEVEKATGVPWAVVAVIHERESGGNFTTYLGNGEPLSRVTQLVPKGRGPFPDWVTGAIDALHLDGLDAVKNWTIERAAYEIEAFNGFGYRSHATHSPYLWAGTSNYTSGKYVADGQFSPTKVDVQLGTMPLLKRLFELDPTAALAGTSQPASPRPNPSASPIAVPAPARPAGSPRPAPSPPKAAPDTKIGVLWAKLKSLF